jgi:nucleoside-diphosphate-sugar epimerase
MSKAFAEELIYKYGFKLPVAIVRPSIIVGAFMEPEPGYVQGFQVIYNSIIEFLENQK